MRYLILLLMAGLAFGETVPGRYIVELTGEPAGRRAARRSAVRAEQAAMRGRMGRAVEVMGSVENVGNALFIAADATEAARLATLPGVRRVRPVRTYKLLLDRAVVVNRIVEAWAEVGDDRAGEGIKIGIIDTGVDSGHAALRDGGLKAPAGYPRTNGAGDEEFTNGKVIVARSYVNLLARRDTDNSARDRVGHGTALAVIAAGTRTEGPLATVQGVAPRAFIGSYKVFGSPNVNDGATDAAILKAIDDAVSDGMDIINLSLGEDLAGRLEEDSLVAGVEKAAAAGVLVVCAAGNNGPDFGTISTPATARSAISVGATRNDRTFGTSVDIEGVGPVLALRGSGVAPAQAVTGPLADVALLDETGLGCGEYASGSLTGKVALILRGGCLFEVKLNNAERAGAVGAIVYATAAEPDPLTMGVGAATLPAQMVSHSTGLLLKERGNGTAVTLRFTLSAVPQEAGRITTFSAIGPNVDLSIKPDLVAVGGNFYVATQSFDAAGDMYSSNGFALVNGTSFSAPLVAGALALLKSARPGLTAEQYRSLLIHSATPLDGVSVQKMGAGQMNLVAALHAPVAVSPATLALGSTSTALRVENLGSEGAVYSISVEPMGGGSAPVASASTLELGVAKAGELAVRFDTSGLGAGAYEGFVKITGPTGELRVPYWSVVRGTEPAAIPLLGQTASGRRNATLRSAVYFRVTDAAGVPIAGFEPKMEAVEGGGSVESVTSLDGVSPGLFAATVRLGPEAGAQVFRITAGEKTLNVSITAQ